MADPMVAHATSADGTPIAYWTGGHGPPLVLVHGTGSLHTTWNALRARLEEKFTVHALDRRGRGASGDGPVYGLDREYEDVAAVVDAVGSASGQAVDLLGHSFGGMCAFNACRLTSNVRRLVLYEGWPVLDPAALATPHGLVDRLDEMLAAGDRAQLLEVFYGELVGLPAEELASMRAIPGWWEARLAVAHTIPRELRTEAAWRLDPKRAMAIEAPTLLLVGSDSPDRIKADYDAVAAVLPNARVAVLDGQQHLAHLLDAERFAEVVLDFLG